MFTLSQRVGQGNLPDVDGVLGVGKQNLIFAIYIAT